MAFDRINPGRLSIANEAALRNHEIDNITKRMDALPDGEELDFYELLRAQENQADLVALYTRGIEAGMFTLEELAFEMPLHGVDIPLSTLGSDNPDYPYDHPED